MPTDRILQEDPAQDGDFIRPWCEGKIQTKSTFMAGRWMFPTVMETLSLLFLAVQKAIRSLNIVLRNKVVDITGRNHFRLDIANGPQAVHRCG